MAATVACASTARRAIAVAALGIAEGYAAAGVHEEGGNNRGDQVEFFQQLMGGTPGDPWCADFVCACLVKAFARLRGLNEARECLLGYVGPASAALIPLAGSCGMLATAAEARGLLRGREYSPQPGDLVLFDFEGASAAHHVGFVRAPSPAFGAVATVEGNTSSGMAGSQRDGDGVYRRVRPRAHVLGFVGW